jgi:FKBP-type peptidyl-prolyl cis-trans isomerase 2
MNGASQGDKVMVNLVGSLNDGTIFVSSKGKSPLSFTIGEGEILTGIEKAVVGMHPGENREVKLPPALAFGDRRSDLVAQVDKESLEGNREPEIGTKVKLTNLQGEDVTAYITDVSQDKVMVDANHPLAGRDCYFKIELLEIEP